MNIHGLAIHSSATKQLDVYVSAPPHAAILVGTVGTGKTHLARQLAAELLQTASLDAGNYPYYREVVPNKGVITIDQVRELIKYFRLVVPGSAAIKRVAVVQDSDAMGTEAQNALLKLLEEPPEGSVLLLTTSRAQGLLPTIRSRAQALVLPSPEEQTVVDHFQALGYEAAAIKQALLRNGSNIAATAQLLESAGGAPDTSVELVKQVLGGTTYDRLLLVDGLGKQKEAARSFVETLLQIATVSLEAAAAKGSATLQRWQIVLQAAYTAQSALESNGNAKLVLTELMLSL